MKDLVRKEDSLLDYVPPILEKGIVAGDSELEEASPEIATLPGVGIWVVSLGAIRSTYCLHIVGSCYRKPTVYFKRWTVVLDPVPIASYRKACQKCIARGYPIVTPDRQEIVEANLDESMPAEVAGSDESSSSSDSSASADN
jgi:hypothetical protein